MRDRQDQLCLGSCGEFRGRRGLVRAMKDESEFGGQIREGQNTGVKGSLESIAGSCPGWLTLLAWARIRHLLSSRFHGKRAIKAASGSSLNLIWLCVSDATSETSGPMFLFPQMSTKPLSPNVFCSRKGLPGVHVVKETACSGALLGTPAHPSYQQPARRKGLTIFPFLPLMIGSLLMMSGKVSISQERTF